MQRTKQLEQQVVQLEKVAAANVEKIRGLDTSLKSAKDVIESLRQENSNLGQEKAMIAGQFKQMQRSL